MTKSFKPGTYELSSTVINPTPDRRKRYDWRKWERWEAGTRFTIEEDEVTTTKGQAPVKVCLICQPGSSYQVNLVSPLGELLAAHFVAIKEEPSDWLRRVHSSNSAAAIIDVLFHAGKITRKDIEDAYAAVLDTR